MAALDLRHVEEAGLAADEGAAGEDQLRHRLQPALVQGAGAIGDALAAFQHRLDGRMQLEALELHVGEEVRILVVQPDHVADVGLVVVQVIDEGAAPGLVVHGPEGRMNDQAFLMLGRVELPKLLHP